MVAVLAAAGPRPAKGMMVRCLPETLQATLYGKKAAITHPNHLVSVIARRAVQVCSGQTGHTWTRTQLW